MDKQAKPARHVWAFIDYVKNQQQKKLTLDSLTLLQTAHAGNAIVQLTFYDEHHHRQVVQNLFSTTTRISQSIKPLAKNATHGGDCDFCRCMVELFNGVLAFEAKKMRGLNPTTT